MAKTLGDTVTSGFTVTSVDFMRHVVDEWPESRRDQISVPRATFTDTTEIVVATLNMMPFRCCAILAQNGTNQNGTLKVYALKSTSEITKTNGAEIFSNAVNAGIIESHIVASPLLPSATLTANWASAILVTWTPAAACTSGSDPVLLTVSRKV